MIRARPIPLWVSAPLLMTVVALTWGTAVNFPLVWTDHAEIEQGALVPKDGAELWRMLTMKKGEAKTTARSAPNQGSDETSRWGYWRPVKAMSYGLDNTLGGGEPWSFHLTNIWLHTGCCLALLLLLRKLWGPTLPGLAEAAALVHALNPLHTEAVAWVSARSDVMLALFTLLAIGSLLGARGRGSAAALGLRFSAGLFCLLAVGSKESGLMAGPILACFAFLLPDQKGRHPISRVLIECGPAAVLLMGLVAFRLGVVGDIQLGALTDRTGLGFWTVLHLFGQNLMQSFSCLAWGVADTVEVLAGPSAVGLLGLPLFGAWLVLGIRRRKTQPLILICALAWLLAILPVSQIVPLLHPRGDRYLYLPALFATTALLLVLYEALRLKQRPAIWRTMAAGMISLVLIAQAWTTSARLATWGDERRLFSEAVEQEPQCIECWNNLAYAEAVAGKLDRAVIACQKALAVDRQRYRGARDGFSLRWIQAKALLLLGRGGEAVIPIEQILARRPKRPALLVMLAQAHTQTGRPDRALTALAIAIRLKPADCSLHLLAHQAAKGAGLGWIINPPPACTPH